MKRSFEDHDDAGLIEKLKSIDQPSSIDVVQVANQLSKNRRVWRRRRKTGLFVVVCSCFFIGWFGVRVFLGSSKLDQDLTPRVATTDLSPNDSADVKPDFSDIDRLLDPLATGTDLLSRAELEETQHGEIEELKREIELMEDRNYRYRRSILREIASRQIQ